jgi:hypothetical protein
MKRAADNICIDSLNAYKNRHLRRFLMRVILASCQKITGPGSRQRFHRDRQAQSSYANSFVRKIASRNVSPTLVVTHSSHLANGCNCGTPFSRNTEPSASAAEPRDWMEPCSMWITSGRALSSPISLCARTTFRSYARDVIAAKERGIRPTGARPKQMLIDTCETSPAIQR